MQDNTDSNSYPRCNGPETLSLLEDSFQTVSLEDSTQLGLSAVEMRTATDRDDRVIRGGKKGDNGRRKL